jgi:hypothetical protein
VVPLTSKNASSMKEKKYFLGLEIEDVEAGNDPRDGMPFGDK